MVMDMPEGDRVMHAEMHIGDFSIMIMDEWPEMEGSSLSLHTLKGTVKSV